MNGDPSLQILGILGTWALVVFGWVVVSGQNDRREIAKNVFARVDKLRVAIGLLESSVVKHHTSGFDLHGVKEIVRSISSVSGEISHLRKFEFADADCVLRMQNFRIAATLHNFDQSSYKQLALDDNLILEFELRKDQLDRALMELAHRVASQPKPLLKAVWKSVRG